MRNDPKDSILFEQQLSSILSSEKPLPISSFIFCFKTTGLMKKKLVHFDLEWGLKEIE